MGWLFDLLFGDGDDDEGLGPCVACDSTDLVELGPSAYRCNGCGYEGGAGYASWQEQQNIAALATRSEGALRERGLGQLEDVRLMLISVAGEVDAAALGNALATGASVLGEFAAHALLGRGLGGIIGASIREEREAAALKRAGEMAKTRHEAVRLRETLLAWRDRPDAGAGVAQALSLVGELMVEETTSDKECHNLQLTVMRIRTLLDDAAA
jgi:hypothetical protein